MVYTINLKSGTFGAGYEPWEVTFRGNVRARAKVKVSRDQKVVLGARTPGARNPGGSWGVPDLCRVIRALTG